MKHIYIPLILLLLLPLTLFAQNYTESERGNFYGDMFLNANHNFESSQTSFRLNRLHFGYKYQFSETLYANTMIESAREDYDPETGYHGITDLFELCFGFKKQKFEGKFGLIGTEFNQQQEKLWKHRYIDKVFADKYGFAPTNDFGLLLILKPIEFLNIDFAVTNGEGHKDFQKDSALRYAAGVSIKPKPGFVARIYGDMLYFPEVQQSNIIGIIGYNSDIFSAAAEWNQQFSSNNISEYQRSGLSAYASYSFLEKFQVFGRFDQISSNIPDNYTQAWNIENDGQLIIAGCQYELNKNIILALDYRIQTSEENNDNNSFVFFDIEPKFE